MTLRCAIQSANSNPGPDVINFQIGPVGGVKTIAVGSAGGGSLPAITDTLTIDGTTQRVTGPTIGLTVQLDGAAAGANSTGLVINANNCTVQGLAITRFVYAGINLLRTSGATIWNNRIGTFASGLAAAGNGIGIVVTGTQNTIKGNLISGNQSDGVQILDDSSSHQSTGNQVLNNAIGTNSLGSSALPNGGNGIRLRNSSDNEISGNTISGNQLSGILVDSTLIGSNSNTIGNNRIGTDSSGTHTMGNHSVGVQVRHSSDTTIRGNIISANSDGVLITDDQGSNAVSTRNSVLNNLIGTDVHGTANLGNLGDGVRIFVSSYTTIQGNVISANHGAGLVVDGVPSDPASHTRVIANRIGTNVSATARLGNRDGVIVGRAEYTTIGETSTGQGNIISGNVRCGVWFNGSTGQGNVVQANLIGTGASVNTPLPNLDSGIRLDASAHITVGGTGFGAGNVIAYNGNDGVTVASGIRNAIQANSIFLNTKLGIDLNADGVTLNDAGDHDGGANGSQNNPVLNSVMTTSASHSRIRGTLNSTPNTTLTLDFYASTVPDPLGYGEGQRWLGSATVMTDANGDVRDGTGNLGFDVPGLASTLPGEWVAATATDQDGNTSEFSMALAVPNPVGLAVPARPASSVDSAALSQGSRSDDRQSVIALQESGSARRQGLSRPAELRRRRSPAHSPEPESRLRRSSPGPQRLRPANVPRSSRA
jgi:parallel beta-helix repeat protein